VALLQSLKEGILGQASVKTIYGDAISAHGKTIIPVAKVMYGTEPAQAPEESAIPAPAAKAAVVAAESASFLLE